MKNKKINPTGYNIKIEPLNYSPSVFDLTEGGIIHDDITVDEELSGTSENPVQNKVITSNINTINNNIDKINNNISNKQDKLTAGNNITITDNIISANIPDVPASVTVDTELSGTSENPVQNKVITNNIDNINNNIDNINNNLSNKQDKLTAGNNITITDNIISANIPDVPASVTVDTELSGTSENPVQNKVITNNINSINDNIDNINNNLSNKQDKLTAGNNVTITDNIISANIPDVPASVTVDTELSGTSENPVQNKVITSNINSIYNNIDSIYNNIGSINYDLSNKQDKLTAGDNITITGNVISASGGSGGSSDFTFEKDTNLTKENNIISTFFPSRNLLFFYINEYFDIRFSSGEISNSNKWYIDKTSIIDNFDSVVFNFQKVKDFIDNINKEGLTDENTPYFNTFFVAYIAGINVISPDDTTNDTRIFNNVFFYGNYLRNKTIIFSNYNYENYEKDSNGNDKYFTVERKKHNITFKLQTDFSSNSNTNSYLTASISNN